jgi:ATP-dependent Lon protease
VFILIWFSPNHLEVYAESNYPMEIHRRRERADVATGLAWTEAGGRSIFVETAGMSIKN